MWVVGGEAVPPERHTHSTRDFSSLLILVFLSHKVTIVTLGKAIFQGWDPQGRGVIGAGRTHSTFNR